LTSPPIASSSRGMSSLMKLPFPLLIAMTMLSCGLRVF
jgi:hypothetical protein